MSVRGFVLVFLQFVILGVLIVTPSHSGFQYSTQIAGLLYSLAVLIAVPAVINLRPSLTAMPEPKAHAPLITHGIYRFIRHPMYTALLLLALGLAVSNANVHSAVLASALLAVLLVKSRYEDRLLRQRWPQASQYQANTGAFLPRIRRHSSVP